jgi:hypothetical protein
LKKEADNDGEILRVLKESEKSVKRRHPGWEQKRGKEGCINADLKHIIEAFPKGILTREAEISAFTFAASCGARAITTCNVRLCDIVSSTLLPSMFHVIPIDKLKE